MAINKKIIQIIPAQPGTYVYFEDIDENGHSIPARDNNGAIMYDKNDNPIGATVSRLVLCYALVELNDGNTEVEPMISTGECIDMAESYIAVEVVEVRA